MYTGPKNVRMDFAPLRTNRRCRYRRRPRNYFLPRGGRAGQTAALPVSREKKKKKTVAPVARSVGGTVGAPARTAFTARWRFRATAGRHSRLYTLWSERSVYIRPKRRRDVVGPRRPIDFNPAVRLTVYGREVGARYGRAPGLSDPPPQAARPFVHRAHSARPCDSILYIKN